MTRVHDSAVIKGAGGDVTPDAFAQAILNVEFDSPAGPFTMDEYGQVITTVWIGEVRDVDGDIRNVVIDSIPGVTQLHGGFVEPPTRVQRGPATGFNNAPSGLGALGRCGFRHV